MHKTLYIYFCNYFKVRLINVDYNHLIKVTSRQMECSCILKNR